MPCDWNKVSQTKQTNLSRFVKRKIFYYIIHHTKNFRDTDHKILLDFLDDIRPNGVVFDIGANVGDISSYILKNCPDSVEVVAYEPDPEAFMSLSQIINSRLEKHNCAIWTEDTKLPLFKNLDISGKTISTSSSLNFSKSNVGGTGKSQTQALDINKILQNYSGREIYIKMDIEGSEYILLNYMIKSGSIKQVKKIYCEFHFNSIRFGYVQHVLLYIQLIKSGNYKKIRPWF